ncbi:MAG TPA: cation:proton antiporter [Flavisolibacter sp.]|nr:cation:proton antiporter [Flavisolibacter sp.]
MGISVELLLIILCSVVVLSYLFSIISQYIKVPSVLLLLFAGIAFRAIADANDVTIPIPLNIVEGLGVVGLIMIVLEAGLDLKLGRDKTKLIRDSFLAALLILILSTASLTAILHYWLREDVKICIVYALPLSIMSSSIVLPSIHHLSPGKKEFLIYEASFSDIIGILLFNYFTAGEILTSRSIGLFGLNILAAVILSLVLSFLLFLVMAKTRMTVKFFFIFSLLILIYSGGKLLHLPSLLIILVFGLMINNWEKIPLPGLLTRYPRNQVEPLREFLHSITAESSFLIRTFFFILFGYSIDLSLIASQEVILIGSLMVLALFVVRFLYLRFVFHTTIFPEVFFIPRGLITIVLFYKIPASLKLTTFNDGILFFIILSTGIILSLGMVFYRKKNDEVIEDPQFSERKDIL